MKEKVIPKSVWGPKAWHLLHAFSIHPTSEITIEEQHSYYLFYKTFYYIIPCQICKIHYRDIFDIFEPLEEKKITRKSLKIWVWKIHNIVNGRLGKKKMEYQKAIEMQKPLQNKEIFILSIMFFSKWMRRVVVLPILIIFIISFMSLPNYILTKNS